MWLALIDSHLLEPIFIPGRFNSQVFLQLLENDLPNLLDDIPLAVRQDSWFQMDGCPVHSSQPVAQWLNRTYPNRWIGRYGPVRWPARSPDLTPMDFYVWGKLKSLVYAEPVETKEELENKIVRMCEEMKRNDREITRAVQAVLKRSRLCRAEGGGHFEHLI